jgi:hypothetical protein
MAKAKMFVGAGTLLVLASCAVSSMTAVPDTSFAPGAPVQAAVAAYYKGHAMEHDGRPCYRPYFDAITKVDVVEEDVDHLVLELRYAFQDRIRDHEDTNRMPPSTRRVCWGFKSRQFTLSKDNGGIQVTEMTGPIRSASSAKSQATLGDNVRVGSGSRFTIGN